VSSYSAPGGSSLSLELSIQKKTNIPVNSPKKETRFTISNGPPPTEPLSPEPEFFPINNPLPSPPPTFVFYDAPYPTESQFYPINNPLHPPPPVISSNSGPTPRKRSFSNVTITDKKVKKVKRISIPSNKRGKKHSNNTIEEELDKALNISPDQSGITPYYRNNSVPGLPSFIVIHEDKFYHFIISSRPEEYRLDKASLLEKFDQSRPCNRVNPKDKSEKPPIKYLRIDNRNKNPDYVKKDMTATKSLYPKQKIRIISHRDWNYISPEEFIYEGKEPSQINSRTKVKKNFIGRLCCFQTQ